MILDGDSGAGGSQGHGVQNRERASLRFVPAVGDVEGTEVEKDEPADELGEDEELDIEDTAGDDAELGTG